MSQQNIHEYRLAELYNGFDVQPMEDAPGAFHGDVHEALKVFRNRQDTDNDYIHWLRGIRLRERGRVLRKDREVLLLQDENRKLKDKLAHLTRLPSAASGPSTPLRLINWAAMLNEVLPRVTLAGHFCRGGMSRARLEEWNQTNCWIPEVVRHPSLARQAAIRDRLLWLPRAPKSILQQRHEPVIDTKADFDVWFNPLKDVLDIQTDKTCWTGSRYLLRFDIERGMEEGGCDEEEQGGQEGHLPETDSKIPAWFVPEYADIYRATRTVLIDAFRRNIHMLANPRYFSNLKEVYYSMRLPITLHSSWCPEVCRRMFSHNPTIILDLQKTAEFERIMDILSLDPNLSLMVARLREYLDVHMYDEWRDRPLRPDELDVQYPPDPDQPWEEMFATCTTSWLRERRQNAPLTEKIGLQLDQLSFLWGRQGAIPTAVSSHPWVLEEVSKMPQFTPVLVFVLVDAPRELRT